MINLIIDCLKYDFKKTTKNIEIAKGKYKMPMSWTEVKHKIKMKK